MEKTKRQLRAEAVERLKGLPTPCRFVADYIDAMLDWQDDLSPHEPMLEGLIYLLTDDEPTCTMGPTFSQLDGRTWDAVARMNALPTTGPAVKTGEAAESDAVTLLRECACADHGMGKLRDRLGVSKDAGWQQRCLDALADKIKHEYVRRESYDSRFKDSVKLLGLETRGGLQHVAGTPGILAYDYPCFMILAEVTA